MVGAQKQKLERNKKKLESFKNLYHLANFCVLLCVPEVLAFLFRFCGRGVGRGVVDVAGSRIGREEEQLRKFVPTKQSSGEGDRDQVGLESRCGGVVRAYDMASSM